MLALVYLCLLAVISTSASPTPSLASSTVYNNCSGDYPVPLPTGTAATHYFKPHVPTNSLQANKNATGWEEWLALAYTLLEDGSSLMYIYKWNLGNPATANLSDSSFSISTHFPNGTSYHGVVNDTFKYEENADGGFTCSIGNNHLTWDPMHEYWNASVNAEGLIAETEIEVVVPYVSFIPNYDSVPGQISDGFFSQMDMPRGHPGGNITFPNGVSVAARGIGILKHSWSHKPISESLSSYVHGTAFLANVPPTPLATLTWFQAWDLSGKEVDSMQLLFQPGDDPEDQVFRIQITDAPETLSITTVPTPSLPLTYESSEVTFPLCAPGADFDDTDQQTIWNTTNVRNLFEFVDSAGGTTLFQLANVTTVAWFNGTVQEFSSGTGIVELYHSGWVDAE